jgi:di/tricarboxylate transporter
VLSTYSPNQTMLVLTIMAALTTEVASNVATASVILPVVNEIVEYKVPFDW